MNRKFVFLHEHDAQRVSVEIDGDSPLPDVLDAVETFLIAAGFAREAVIAALGGGIRPDAGEEAAL